MTGSENTSRYGWNYVNKFRNNKLCHRAKF